MTQGIVSDTLENCYSDLSYIKTLLKCLEINSTGGSLVVKQLLRNEIDAQFERAKKNQSFLKYLLKEEDDDN